MKIPGYQELSPVAQGGFASVFRARQVAFDREVAVKVLTVELGDGRDRRRFERECVLTGRLTGHPAIVTILDSGFTDHGQPYLTTPFYHAGSLAERLRVAGPSSPAEVLRIGVAVAGALEMAHRNGILHRDVKPGNVLLSAYGEPALTDFGIAALVQANGATATQLTQAFTIDHAPPEVLEGGRATVCADVYSLGSTLWTLLTGHAPFAGGDPGLIPRALKVRNDPVPPIGRADVPPSLEAALVKAMAKRPEDRFDTAAAFGEALQQIQRELGEPETPLRADAPLRTAPPRPADDDLAVTEAPLAAAQGASTLAPPLPPPAAPVPRWRSGESGWPSPNDPPRGDGAPERGREALAATRVDAAAGAAPARSPSGPALVATGAPSPAGPPAPAAARFDPAPSAAATPDPAPVAGPAAWGHRPDRRRRGLVPAIVVLVVAIVAAWLVLRPRGGDTTITTPNPGDPTTTAVPPTTAAPPAPTVTAAPPTTTAAPTTAKAAPTAAPTTAPPTKAPAPPTTTGSGAAILPPGASAEVVEAAGIAQRAGDALADGDWAAVRTLIPSLASSSDATLDAGWGRLDGVTMVVTDSKERRGQVTLRVGEVAHERNTDDSRRTNLYCATWTIDGGRVVGMAAQQGIEPTPWRDGWADPADAVDLLRKQCRKL